jgi:hypothetical protein
MPLQQAPAAVQTNTMEIGNGLLFYSPNIKASLAAAVAATDWIPVGQTKAGAQVQGNNTLYEINSGMPQRAVLTVITGSELLMGGELVELDEDALALATGFSGAAYTYQTVPAATTVAASSTATLLKVAAGTNYRKDHVIEVEMATGGLKVYRAIQSVSGNDIVPYKPFPSAPVSGGTVKGVATSATIIGNQSIPAVAAFKLVKTAQDGGLIEIYMFKAQQTGGFNLNMPDNGSVEVLGLPFSYKALSDATIENGGLGAFRRVRPAIPS